MKRDPLKYDIAYMTPVVKVELRAGIILPIANESRRYIATSSLIGWAYIPTDPWRDQISNTKKTIHTLLWRTRRKFSRYELKTLKRLPWVTCDMCCFNLDTWWRHPMETFSTLLAICAENSPVPGEFPAQRPVTRGFDVFFDLRLNKWLSKQSWGWWFESVSCPLGRHCNDLVVYR